MKSLKTNPSVFERRKKIEMTVSVQSSLDVNKKVKLASSFSTYIRRWLLQKRFITTKELRSIDIRYSTGKTCITVFIGFYHPIDTEKIDKHAEFIRSCLVSAFTLLRNVFTFDDSLSEQEKSCKTVDFYALAQALSAKSEILQFVGI